MIIETFFIAVDGDLVGRKIEKLIISSELDELVTYSHLINESVNKMRSFSENIGGKTYLQGGDNLLVEVADYQAFVEQIISSRAEMAASFSVGIGRNAVEAYLALKFAKSAGRGLIILVEVIDGKYQFKHIA
ncbi:mCpol domain-containing protein [Floridanema evergladense]|uniref:MCpol domain-containing protein n=1 Tax=Floridaenema evergladense BLCC-F167 TaxID=3153639 RepID=A0ABV4WWP0_9CYAN